MLSHDTVTLIEFPPARGDTSSVDDQAVKQNNAGRDVTVVKRGKGSITYTWHQSNLTLTLSNLYDPPGQPGDVR